MNFFCGQNEIYTRTIMEQDILDFAKVSEDFNPIYINKVEAEKSIFGRQVVHGMLITSIISSILGMKMPGPGTIYLKQEVSFLKPVYINDTVTVEVKIIDITERRKAVLTTTVTNQKGEKVIDGTATVLLPK